jgi:hypothetical protein
MNLTQNTASEEMAQMGYIGLGLTVFHIKCFSFCMLHFIVSACAGALRFGQ